MFTLAMLEESLTVIAGHDHQRAAAEGILIQESQDSPGLLVYIRNLAGIKIVLIAGVEGFRRVVGKVRIIVMNPQEEAFLGVSTEPREGVVCGDGGAPFDNPTREKGSALRRGHLIVIHIKPAPEAELPSHRPGANKRCRS